MLKERCFAFVALLTIVLISLPGIASAQCSADDIRSYVESGATAEQLSRLCGRQDGPSSDYYPEIASICVTRLGTCSMVEPLPIGSRCDCYTTYGVIPGIAQ